MIYEVLHNGCEFRSQTLFCMPFLITFIILFEDNSVMIGGIG